MSEMKQMDAATLEALKGSIAKWEKIVAGTGGDSGDKNCPLCALFLNHKAKPTFGVCAGCPVQGRVYASGCVKTPYEKWVDLHDDADDDEPLFADTPTRKAAAQAELDFLKSLLPQESAQKAADMHDTGDGR